MNNMMQFIKKQKTIRNMIVVYYANFILLLIYLLSENSFKFVFVINILLFFLSIYFLYFFTKKLSFTAIEETKDIIYAKHKQMQEEHLEAMKENSNSVKAIKEKLYSEADTWQAQHQEESIQQDIIKELISKQASFTEINYCENAFIDAMLYNKLLLAKKQNIQIYTQIIAPSDLNIVSLDLISLFTNLIDNAIEATTKASKPFLSIEFYPVVSCFVLKVTNSKHKDDYIDLSLSRSSKDKQFEHGIGLQIVKNIVKKYDGKIYINQSDEVVTFQIVGLNIHTTPKDTANKRVNRFSRKK